MEMLVVTGIFPPDIGGPASYVPKIATEFFNMNHNVEVVCLSDAINHDDSKYSFKVFRILRNQFKPFRWFKTVLTIRKHAKNKDVIYVNGLSFEVLISLIFLNVPAVHKIVGDYSWERARNHGWFKGTIDEYQKSRKNLWLKLMDWVRTYPLKKAKNIIVPSNYLKKIVTGWGIDPEKINVVYNAIDSQKADTDKQSNVHGEAGKTIITVCRLVPWKGLKELIELMKDLSNTKLLIAGDGPMREELLELTRNLGVEDKIVFLGHVSQAEVSKYLKVSDCFILNSSYEGLPHVVLEAMAAQVPVIATDVGGTSEVVIHNKTGILVKFGDLLQLKLEIHDILNNKDKSTELVNGAKQFVNQYFNYGTMIQKTADVLIRTASRGNTRGNHFV